MNLTPNHLRPRSAHGAFTLVELLVVIAIIGILVALLLPAIQAAREAARRTQCMNNQKQMALAALNYENTLKELPPIYVSTDQRWRLPADAPNPSKPSTFHGLHIYLLPYMEYQPVHDEYDFAFKWSDTVSSNNGEVVKTNIPELICPSAPSITERSGKNIGGGVFATTIPGGFADYGINGRVHPKTRCQLLAAGFSDLRDWSGLFTGGEVFATGSWAKECPSDAPGSQDPVPGQTGITKLKHCTDGLSHTIMFSPDAGRPFYYEDGVLAFGVVKNDATGGSQWASPDNEWWTHDLCGGGNSLMNCHNDNENYSFHVGGGVYSFGDGSVRFIADNIPLELQIALMTRAAEDLVDTF
jgi:prepilin-type N-terminal cleavage/methylation domain-containing protein